MRTVPLTKGMVALVDDEDYERITCHKWHATKGRTGGWYARSHTAGYMQRFLTGTVDPTTHVDHKNLDSLDNQKGNLRVSTRAQNVWNTGPRANGKSRFKGVHSHKALGKWTAEIRANGAREYLGIYTTEEEAAVAYNEAARRLHGEHAYQNEIG